LPAGLRERRLEELPNDAEDEGRLELAAACAQHFEIGADGQLSRSTKQPRLADPSAPLDDDESTFAALKAVLDAGRRGEGRLVVVEGSACGQGRRPSPARSQPSR